MRLIVLLVTALIRLGGWLPLAFVHAQGRALARVLALLGTRESKVARTNVKLCFPELEEPAARRFLRDTRAETGMCTLELATFWGRRPERVLSLVRRVEGLEHVRAAQAQGRGLLIAAPHLGAWELLNLYLATLAPLTILYRVPKHRAFEQLLLRSRTVLGAEAVRAEPAGVRLLFRRLKEGRMVGILPDQRPKGGEGVDVPFFGHTARTMTLVSRLAHKTQAPVLLAFAERLPRSEGFVVHFVPAEPEIGDADPVVGTAALNRGIEACVRLCPTQYQWTYKRFSFRRRGDPPDLIYGKVGMLTPGLKPGDAPKERGTVAARSRTAT